jgi:hypothetical protein
MLDEAKRVLDSTRKKHDQAFNLYVMRPMAAVVVAWLAPTRTTPNQVTLLSLGTFVIAASALVAVSGYWGGILSVVLIEGSYLLDCADGMLARYKRLASKEGHLFDYFTDELKALLLTAGLSIRLARTGRVSTTTLGNELLDPRFLLAGVLGVFVVASAISLTSFVRRPEVSGRETPIEAHYDSVPRERARGPVAWLMAAVRLIAHYPSQLWAFALVDRFDVFFGLYVAVHLAFLVRGWAGLVLRFGTSAPRSLSGKSPPAS